MTDKDTDDTEQPSRDELESRVEQLEQTVQQMLPSRRDALKLGGTALAAGALGSAATGSASAGTNSVGQIGSASNPIDAELEDVNPGSTRAVNFNNNEITNVSSLSTEQLTLNEQAVRMFQSTSQTVSSGTAQTVKLDSVSNGYNPGSTLTADTANNQITVQKPGIYLALGQVALGNPSSTTSISTNINLGGSVKAATRIGNGSNASNMDVPTQDILTIGGTPANISLAVFHDEGSGLNITAKERRTVLTVARLG